MEWFQQNLDAEEKKPAVNNSGLHLLKARGFRKSIRF